MTELPLLVQRKYEDPFKSSQECELQIMGAEVLLQPLCKKKKTPLTQTHRRSLPKSPDWYFIQTGVFKVVWAMIYLCGCERLFLGSLIKQSYRTPLQPSLQQQSDSLRWSDIHNQDISPQMLTESSEAGPLRKPCALCLWKSWGNTYRGELLKLPAWIMAS